MSGHTPGPWLLQETTVYALNEERIPVNRFTASIDSGWRNAESRISRNEVEANAQLIAAAPELLDALESLKCELILSDVDMDYIESHFRPWLDKAAAAIAKARGTA